MNPLALSLTTSPSFTTAEEMLARARTDARCAVELEPNVHFVDGVFVRFTLATYVEDEINPLTLAASLGVSSSPRLAGQHSWETGEAVIITTVPGCEHAPWAPLPAGPLPAALTTPVERDVARLADAGWIHPWLSRGFEHWHLSGDRSRIVLSGWASLRAPRDGELAEVRTALDRLLLSRRG